jgi:hypothetical protein
VDKQVVNYSQGILANIGDMWYPVSNDRAYIDYGFQDNSILTDLGGNQYIMFRDRIRYIAEILTARKEVTK